MKQFLSVRIAGELGMTKGALYRHYKSKRDIFDHVIKKMEQGDGEQAGEYDMPADKKENEAELYEMTSMDNFMEYSKSMFFYIGQKTILHHHSERCLR